MVKSPAGGRSSRAEEKTTGVVGLPGPVASHETVRAAGVGGGGGGGRGGGGGVWGGGVFVWGVGGGGGGGGVGGGWAWGGGVGEVEGWATWNLGAFRPVRSWAQHFDHGSSCRTGHRPPE